MSGSAASGRIPTEKQYGILRMLGSGSALLTGTRRDVEPMVRHGWVTSDHGYSWVRITPAGLYALGRGAEKYGWPEMQTGSRYEPFCSSCGKPWHPKCSCGSSHYVQRAKEYERATA